MKVLFQDRIKKIVLYLQKFIDRVWYAPTLGALALIDNFVLVVPTDGILISSTMLVTRRWVLYALAITIGSTIGAGALASVVEYHGLPWVLEHYPGIEQTKSWIWTVGVFEKYGLWLVFLIAISPLVQQPAVILAGLANTPLTELIAIVFTGRLLKYLFMAYIASHAPRLLSKLWGLERL